MKQQSSQLLQSKLWAKVQQARGRDVFYLDDILIIKHQLLLGKTWLYSAQLNLSVKKLIKIIPKIKKIAQKEKAIFWKVESIFGQPLKLNKNLKLSTPLQPYETFLIDLSTSKKKLLKNMKQKTRYNIRLAKRKGVKVYWSQKQKDLNIFYSLLNQTAKRQKIKLHPKKHYQNILKIFGPKNKAKIIVAEYKKEPIAANLIIFFGNTATYLHGGTSKKHRTKMAPYLLQWQAILKAKKQDLKFYDLGGCAVKKGKIKEWAGLTRFKSGFGGQLYQFGETYDLIFKKMQYQIYQLRKKIKIV